MLLRQRTGFAVVSAGNMVCTICFPEAEQYCPQSIPALGAGGWDERGLGDGLDGQSQTAGDDSWLGC